MTAGDTEVRIITPRAFQCSEFDGVDDYLNKSADPRLYFASGALSISGWVKYKNEQLANVYPVVSTTADYFIKGSTAGAVKTLQFSIQQQDSSYKASSAYTPLAGVWYHFVGVAPGSGAGNVILYVNGVLTGAGTAQTGDIKTGVKGIKIGAGSSTYFAGEIRMVRFHNKSLTQAEVNELYAGTHPTSAAFNLVAEYKLEKNYNDTSGNALHLTNNGARLTIADDKIAESIQAMRTSANDKWILTNSEGDKKQIVVIKVEEA